VGKVVVRAQGSVYAADVVAIRNEVKLENKSKKSERVLVSLIKEEECRVSSKCDDEDDDELTSVSGNNIANGIPGNPPPVPTSSIFSPGKNETTFAIANECRI
jgi:hypothetical protein